MAKDKDEDSSRQEFEAPGIIDFFKKKWRLSGNEKSSATDDGHVFEKIGRVFSDYSEIREKHEKNVSAYEAIAEGSFLRIEFFILLLGSALIATFGLYQNSAAVIIGAMLIAPLMMPILGFSLGSIWGDRRLLGNSLLTLFVGTMSVLAATSAISYILPGYESTEQMAARTNPNLYDILIALASGTIGAYAFVNPRISSSISGVAIAVALVPPLSVTGISLGQVDYKAALGSFLLYLSNLVGISLAASFVFWRMKIHPVLQEQDEVDMRARRKVFLATAVLLIIAIPLGIFMRDSLYIKTQEKSIRRYIESNLSNVEIDSLKIVKYIEGYKINCRLILAQDLSPDEAKKMKKEIAKMFQARAELNLIILKAQVL